MQSYQRHLSGNQRLSMDTPPLPGKVSELTRGSW